MKELAEAVIKTDSAFLREHFNPEEISTFGWVPGYSNIAHGLTKDNQTSVALVLRSLPEGVSPLHPDSIMRHAEFKLIGKSPPTNVCVRGDISSDRSVTISGFICDSRSSEGAAL